MYIVYLIIFTFIIIFANISDLDADIFFWDTTGEKALNYFNIHVDHNPQAPRWSKN